MAIRKSERRLRNMSFNYACLTYTFSLHGTTNVSDKFTRVTKWQKLMMHCTAKIMIHSVVSVIGCADIPHWAYG
jgi:hypothetical protein